MKKIILIISLLILFLYSIYFIIKQPLFFKYNFDKTLILREYIPDENNLQNHVKFLSQINRTSEIWQKQVVNYIMDELEKNWINKDNIKIQKYIINNREYQNIIVNFKKSESKKVNNKKYIIGWHYDAYWDLPWADDNASAIAGLLEISKVFKNEILDREIDLVFYSTEEPPFFATENMWSFHHAKSIENKDDIELVIILEMIGYYSEEKNSQNFPVSFLKYFYPNEWNFIAIVSNLSNLWETRQVKKRFKTFLERNNLIKVESINAPSIINGVDFSDHRNYWQFDIPAIMITDTSFYRNKNYHTTHDTYEKLDYKKMKEVLDSTIVTILSL